LGAGRQKVCSANRQRSAADINVVALVVTRRECVNLSKRPGPQGLAECDRDATTDRARSAGESAFTAVTLLNIPRSGKMCFL
jgi:hypothetical protein